MEEQIAPTPPQEKPEVVAPPEQKVEMKPATEPAKPVPDAKPTPVKPKVVRPEAKKPTEAPPAPRTTALAHVSNARRRPPPPPAPAHRPRRSHPTARCVRAHLMRFKQYPPGANGQQGVAGWLSRSAAAGRCCASRLGGSSGVAALDAQAMAMVRHAQPFPAFPPDITQGSMSFTVPVAFTSLR